MIVNAYDIPQMLDILSVAFAEEQNQASAQDKLHADDTVKAFHEPLRGRMQYCTSQLVHDQL